MNVKQVIVVRKDLNMRSGKIAAQVAHASMKVLLDRMTVKTERGETDSCSQWIHRTLTYCENGYISEWLNGLFTKVVVRIDSEQEFDKLYNLIETTYNNIPHAMIIDSGLTEFHGVPTKTCFALGPWDSNEIDEITGHLKLL